ncbi:MAG TPA: hypothetical protein VGS21_07100 [Acidimicrobiales bacterium]|nr:hypothetical protein [Acidimicrobiales bacterium]
MTDELPAEVPDTGSDGLGFDMLAASLRADASESKTFLNVLGNKLLAALPSQVTLEHERKRFRETDRVLKIEVTLEELEFRLEEAGGRIVAMISHVVRGMRLRSDEVGVDEWIDRLSRKLAEAAASSARARDAISGLLT